MQATIGIDFLSKTMYLEDRTVSTTFVSVIASLGAFHLKPFHVSLEFVPMHKHCISLYMPLSKMGLGSQLFISSQLDCLFSMDVEEL